MRCDFVVSRQLTPKREGEKLKGKDTVHTFLFIHFIIAIEFCLFGFFNPIVGISVNLFDSIRRTANIIALLFCCRAFRPILYLM